MFKDAVSFDQDVCSWNRSPTASDEDFCLRSSCGACSLCTVTDVLQQTIYVPGNGYCWRIQLAPGGTLEADGTDKRCSKPESDWQSNGIIYSLFSDVSLLDNTATFTAGAAGFSGTFQFVEDPLVTAPVLKVLDWTSATKCFKLQVKLPSCSSMFCPSLRIDL